MKFETLYDHPYKIILVFILMFFSFLALQGYYFLWWADAEIYLNIAQVLFNDGVLYKDAIDTKNIGFLFFWYFMYFPYASLFDTMQFFPIWHGLILSTLYFGIGSLSYTIANQIYDNKLSLLTAIAMLFILFGDQHSLFINQAPTSVLFILFFLLYLHKTFETQSYLNFFIYGILLALAFSFAHILAPLVLIVPFLVIQKDIIIDKKYLTAFYKCTIAAIGFFCVIGIIFIYLYRTDSVMDWVFWNTIFPFSGYTPTMRFGIFNNLISFSTSNFFVQKTLIFLSFFSIGNNFRFPLSYSLIVHYFFLSSCIISFIVLIYRKYIIKKQFNFSSLESTLMFFGFLCIIPRFFIGRVIGSDSYNIYLLPFILCYFPLFYRSFPLFKKIMNYGVFVALFICLTYIPFRYFLYPLKISTPSYVKQLTVLNPDKKPTVINYPWHTNLYATQWKPLFYAHVVVDNYNFMEKIMILEPELFFYSVASSYARPVPENFLPFIEKNYQQVLENTYIKKDMVSSWNLPK